MTSRSAAALAPNPFETASSTGPVDASTLSGILERKGDEPFEIEPAAKREPGALGSSGTSALNAGRQVALKVTDQEYAALVERHRGLARKKVTAEITRSEALELQLVRWELDRIEDARTGPTRDLLRAVVRPRTEFAAELTRFVEELRASGVGGGRRRGGAR